MLKRSTKSALPKDVEIGLRIRAQRLVAGMSQTDLANKLGVTFQQVQKYERGVNRVGAGRLDAVAKALGVTPSFFFDGVEAASGFSKADVKAVDTGIGLLRTEGAVRVLQAYSAMPPNLRQMMIVLTETLAGAAR